MWLIGDRYIAGYVLLGTLTLLFTVAGYLALVWLGVVVLGRLVPRRWREPLARRRTQITMVTAVTLFLLWKIGIPVNRTWLPGRFHPVSIVGNFAMLAVALMLARYLFRVRRNAGLVYGAVALAAVFVGARIASVTGAAQTHVPVKPGASNVTEALATLPYIAFVPESEGEVERGVAYVDHERAYPGLNLCASISEPRALLLDLDGNVVHEWFKDIDPGYPWEFVALCDNGDLLVSIQNRKLMRLDVNSRVKWVRRLRCHHDLDVAPDGDIYVLQRSYRFVSIHGLPTPVRDDHVVVLSPDGQIKSEFSLGELLRDVVPFSNALRTWRWQLTNMRFSIEHRIKNSSMWDKGYMDLLHANTITIVNHDVGNVLRKGQLVVCSPLINVVAVIDPAAQKVVWHWGPGELEGPHNPTVLDNGNILVFDNGTRRQYTRVVEVEPETKRIAWSYESDSRGDFYSPVCGASQRLPNGNTLITDSVGGRSFEVTPDGQIVWEFFTPVPGDEDVGGRRPTIYRMERITDPNLLSQLGG